MRKKTFAIFFLLIALSLSLLSSCAPGGNTAQTSDTSGQSAQTDTGSTVPETTAQADGALEFEYITADSFPEGAGDGKNYVVISGKDEFTALYGNIGGHAVDKGLVYFDESFFEKYTVIAIKMPMPHTQMAFDVQSAVRRNGELIVGYNVYSYFFGNGLSEHAGWLILDKNDYDGEEIVIEKYDRYIVPETLAYLLLDDYKEEIFNRGLAALEKYAPENTNGTQSTTLTPEQTTGSPPETTAAPNAGLSYDYFNVYVEGTREIERDDSSVETFVLQSREQLLALYEQREYGMKARIKAWLTDDFFESHTVIAVITSMHYPHFFEEVSSVKIEDGWIIIAMTEYGLLETDLSRKSYEELGLVFRNQCLIIMDKLDNSIQNVNVIVNAEFPDSDALYQAVNADYERSLLTLEKYRP